jgi:hypothetical protein
MAELQIMKHNLKEIGVAQKLVHNLTGKTIPAGAFNCLAVTSGFDVSLNLQVKFKVSWFRAYSGCPSYKYHLGH